MGHSKKTMVCLLAAAAILTGCGQSRSTAEGTDIQTVRETPAIATGVIEAYPLKINGKYGYQSVLGGKMETGEKEYSFTGYPTDINITSNSSGILEIESVVANDFFETAEPVKIVYEYGDLVTGATIENNGDLIVEPTQPFDFDMFYDESRRLKIEYIKKVEKTTENPILGFQKVEIPITKDNVEKIEYAYNIEYPKVGKARTGERSAFFYNGGILFTLKNGDKYVCSSYLKYRPKQKDYTIKDKSPIWDIEISAPGKIE